MNKVTSNSKLKDILIKKFKELNSVNKSITEKESQIRQLTDQFNYLRIGKAKLEAEIESIELEIGK